MVKSWTEALTHVKRATTRAFLGLLSSLALLLSGCAARRSQAIPWNTAGLVRPIVIEQTSPPEIIEDPVPDLRLELPPPPAPLAAPGGPARPRSAASSANENARTERLDAPRIVPELSPQESVSLRRETDESLIAAERSLSTTKGKSLNAMQSDLASKVRSFMGDSREAGRAGDWARALNLAKKAQVLAEQLANSLS